MTTEQLKDFFIGTYLNLGMQLNTEWENWNSYYINNVDMEGSNLKLTLYLSEGWKIPNSNIKPVMGGKEIQLKRKKIVYSVSERPKWRVYPSWVKEIQPKD